MCDVCPLCSVVDEGAIYQPTTTQQTARESNENLNTDEITPGLLLHTFRRQNPFFFVTQWKEQILIGRVSDLPRLMLTCLRGKQSCPPGRALGGCHGRSLTQAEGRTQRSSVEASASAMCRSIFLRARLPFFSKSLNEYYCFMFMCMGAWMCGLLSHIHWAIWLIHILTCVFIWNKRGSGECVYVYVWRHNDTQDTREWQ